MTMRRRDGSSCSCRNRFQAIGNNNEYSMCGAINLSPVLLAVWCI